MIPSQRGVKRKKTFNLKRRKKFKGIKKICKYASKAQNILSPSNNDSVTNTRSIAAQKANDRQSLDKVAIAEKGEFSEKDDNPTDDLIKKLSELRDSCQKPSHRTPRKSFREKIHFTPSVVSFDCEKEVSGNPKSSTGIGKKKNRRKKWLPKKIRLKEHENESKPSVVSHAETDDDEPTLTIIDEPKKKRKSKRTSIPIPDKLMEMILKSGIDDVLEEKAEKRKLTATHVKNIIKHIITDENVVQMVKNSVYGIGSESAVFEPKLTRAKTKELYEKQLKEITESGNLPRSTLWFGPVGGTSESHAGNSLQPEMRSLITTEFPDEEDDEEYQPGLNEQLISDDESCLSKLSSPSSTPGSSTFLTPSSVSSSTGTPSSIVLHTPTGTLLKFAKSKAVSRSLDFSKTTTPGVGQIGSRTRSKYPMTDTPIEYLESQFRPPDITADMYETECEDEDWKQFLLEYLKPQDKAEESIEDDEHLDPEYNLLQDVEEIPNVDDIHEEMRGDKGVRITKKEYSQLIEEFLDTFDTEPYESSEQTHYRRKEASTSLEEPINRFSEVASNMQFYFPQESVMYANNSEGPSSEFSKEVWQPKVTVTYLVPHFTPFQIKVLESQMALHVQLLTSTILNTNHRPIFNYIKQGATEMLHSLMSYGKVGRPGGRSLFHPINLQEALNTVSAFDRRKNEAFSNGSTCVEEEVMANPNFYMRYSRKLPGFPLYLREVYLSSSAFVFPRYLPPGLFHGNLFKKRGRFRNSEYWLLASCFKEVMPNMKDIKLRRRSEHSICFNEELYNLCNKIGKSGLLYATGHQIAQKVESLLLANKIHKQFEDNPVVQFLKSGKIELPTAKVEKICQDPSSIKDMHIQVLPKPFKLYVEKYHKQNLGISLLEPIAGSSIKSIVIVQDAFGTKIILPPNIPPTVVLGNKHSDGPTPSSRTVGYPSFCIFKKEAPAANEILAPTEASCMTVPFYYLPTPTGSSLLVGGDQNPQPPVAAAIPQTAFYSQAQIEASSDSTHSLTMMSYKNLKQFGSDSHEVASDGGPNKKELKKMLAPNQRNIKSKKNTSKNKESAMNKEHDTVEQNDCSLPLPEASNSALKPSVSSHCPSGRGNNIGHCSDELCAPMKNDNDIPFSVEGTSPVEERAAQTIFHMPLLTNSPFKKPCTITQPPVENEGGKITDNTTVPQQHLSTEEGNEKMAGSTKFSNLKYSDENQGKKELIVVNYIRKVKVALASRREALQSFISILLQFIRDTNASLRLFKEISKILSDYPDLIDEFVMFLNAKQASKIGKRHELRILTITRKFINELEKQNLIKGENLIETIELAKHLFGDDTSTLDDAVTSLKPLLVPCKTLRSTISKYFKRHKKTLMNRESLVVPVTTESNIMTIPMTSGNVLSLAGASRVVHGPENNPTNVAALVTPSSMCLAVVAADTNSCSTSLVGMATTTAGIPCILVTPPKKSIPRIQRQYRLLKKSPLKYFPARKVSPILRQTFRRGIKCKKNTSPRKLKFILPKQIRARSKQRCLKAKPSPVKIIENMPTILLPDTRPSVQFTNVINTTECIRPLFLEKLTDQNEETRVEKMEAHPNEIDCGDSAQQQLQEERLVAFLKASSTIAGKPHGGGVRKTRPNKQQKSLQDKILEFSYCPDLKSQERALALSYMAKVRKSLTSVDPQKFEDFVLLFNSFSVKTDCIETLFFKIWELLEGFDELKEEFVMFLTADQAVAVGKYFEFCTIMKMREFVDELRYRTMKQPQNFQKVLKTLQGLVNRPSVTQKEVLESLSSQLRFHPQLIESLKLIFPSSRPPKSLPSDFEEIRMDSLGEDQLEHPSDFEVITLIDHDVKPLTDNCSCDCHGAILTGSTTNAASVQQNKMEHCSSCGLRFIDGRVYLQFGKTLRPAKVIIGKKKEEPTTLHESSVTGSQMRSKVHRMAPRDYPQTKLSRKASKSKSRRIRLEMPESIDGNDKARRGRAPKRKFSKVLK